MKSCDNNDQRTKQEGRERIAKAQREFSEMFEEVKPFIRKRRTGAISTTGRWKVVSLES